MDCPVASSITFSPRSNQAIEEIRRIRQSVNALSVALSAGVLGNIFLGNSALDATYAIQGADFKKLSQAMSGMPILLRRRIMDEADRAALDVTNYHERQFWQAVAAGCKVH